MRKKNMLRICAACLIAVILCGCQPTLTPEPTSPGNSEPTAPLIQGLPMPENPGNTLISYDPEREIYFFGCENVDSTIYLKSGGVIGLEILLMSKSPLDPTRIQVSAQIQNAYEVQVLDLSQHESLRETVYTALTKDQKMDEISSPSWLAYYMYQCYAGVDFTQLGQLWQDYLAAAQERIDAGYLSPGAEETAAYEAFVDMRDKDISAFQALTGDQTREFYVYTVNLIFDTKSTVDEYLHEIDITIDGVVFHQEIGQLHLVPDLAPAAYPRRKLSSSFSMVAPGTTPYSDGLCRAPSFQFKAEEDMTLLSYNILEEQYKILDMFLTIQSNDGTSANFRWDGSSPVYLTAGDSVSAVLIFHNPAMGEFSYNQTLHEELVYELEGKTYSHTAASFFGSTVLCNYHDLYAVVFDGVDMESYYRDYYYPIYEPWMANYMK